MGVFTPRKLINAAIQGPLPESRVLPFPAQRWRRMLSAEAEVSVGTGARRRMPGAWGSRERCHRPGDAKGPLGAGRGGPVMGAEGTTRVCKALGRERARAFREWGVMAGVGHEPPGGREERVVGRAGPGAPG